MCRMILAQGRFDPAEILRAARKMARGACAVAPAPSATHPNGFGLLWQDPASDDGFRVLHALDDLGQADLSDILGRGSASLAATRFLAIHARHATLQENLGLPFCHPLRQEVASARWFFMHNGYLPTVHSRLGQESSCFDSAEYFAVILREHADGIDANRLTDMLGRLPQPQGAANFFAVKDRQAWAYNWWPEDSAFSEFYALRVHADEERTVVASDEVEDLAAVGTWRKLEKGALLRFDLTPVSP